MTFDVASVRPVKTVAGHSYVVDYRFQPPNSSHLTMTNCGVHQILRTAFAIMPYQLVGFDSLSLDLRALLYTIQARSGEDADKRLAKLPKAQREAEQQHMLQALLIDRFRLEFHWEDRLLPGYRLVIAKRGSKLLPAGSLPMDSDGLRMRTGDGKMPVIHQHNGDLGGTYIVGRGASLPDMVEIISGWMRSPVQDATGLGGKYDFDLRFFGRTAEDNPRENPEVWPPMMDSVQDQLGLRLEAAKLMQKVLVIDHMEAPSPN
jgi:uncharacterized protein (TIGR03435 family)